MPIWLHITLIAYEFQDLQFTHYQHVIVTLKASRNGRRWQLGSSKGPEHWQNAFNASYKVKRVAKATVLCEISKYADNIKLALRGFSVAQCTYAT